MTTQQAEITALSGDPFKMNSTKKQEQKQEQENKNKKSETKDVTADESTDQKGDNAVTPDQGAFQRSRMMQRSPISNTNTVNALVAQAKDPSKNTGEIRKENAGNIQCTGVNKNQNDTGPQAEESRIVQDEAPTQDNSPKRDYIRKTRKDEEDALLRCKTIVEKMKEATTRQRNISMDIKNGLVELDEVLDVIHSYRNSWLLAERQSSKVPKSVLPTPKVDDQNQRQRRAQRVMENNSNPTQKDVTPSTSQKRLASSPAEQNNEKKQKRPEPHSGWTTVVSRKPRRRTKDGKVGGGEKEKTPSKNTGGEKKSKKSRKRKREVKPRPEALLIKPAQGQTYAGVLKEIKQTAKPEETETEIQAIRRSRNGDIILEFASGAKNKESFCETLKGIVGQNAKVVNLEPKATIEIRDLDSLTTTEEVEQAVKRNLKEYDREVKVFFTKPNSREQKIAFVEMDETGARQVLQSNHIKVGWINCRIRLAVVVTRCFKCFGYGHRQAECKAQDRKGQGLCARCGQSGHKKGECKTTPTCYLCKEINTVADHIPGTGACAVFRQALEKARTDTKKRKC